MHHARGILRIEFVLASQQHLPLFRAPITYLRLACASEDRALAFGIALSYLGSHGADYFGGTTADVGRVDLRPP